MKSATAVTPEIDDLDLAVKELSAQIKEKLQFDKNSIGIAYCDADMDIAGFGARLHAELGIDIVGLTTTATVERHSGYNDMGVLLCVLTADDVTFSIGSTGELKPETFASVIHSTYKEARARLHEDPKLILSLLPYNTAITSESYVEALDEASGGVPVFGGVTTDHYDLKYQKTLYNGQEFLAGLVFVLLAGNVRPVFAMEHSFSGKTDRKGLITKSEGNQVLKVGDQTLKEFVASIVPISDEELVVFHFQATPFVMELPDYEPDEQPVVRVLTTIDHQRESGGFLTKMPEGSTIYMNILQLDDLRKSSAAGLSTLLGKMKENTGYEYSALFICTCNARHQLMGGTKSMESEILGEVMADLPPSLNATGFYGFGETCPTGFRADGTAKNRFHNVSFAVCAI